MTRTLQQRAIAAEKPTEPALPVEPNQVITSPETPDAKRERGLPDNVQHHHRDALPNMPQRELGPAHTRDPQRPPKPAPKAWQGSYNQCSGCGDFLGSASRCARCTPVAIDAPQPLPKMVAR